MAVRRSIVFLRILLTSFLLLQPCIQADNIAQGKPAKQINKQTWQTNTRVKYGPALAVDGNTNQNLARGSCAKPNSDDRSTPPHDRRKPAWWQVELSPSYHQQYVIKSVTIYFSSCCKGNIAGTYISGSLSGYQGEFVQCAHVTNKNSVQTLQCNLGTPVRYLRIGHPKLRTLYLCEVVVDGYPYKACDHKRWGEGCQRVCSCMEGCDAVTGFCNDNIVRGKPAKQINIETYQTDTGVRYGPALAVDGNTNPNLNGGSCAKPDSNDRSTVSYWRGRPAWWQVELHQLFVIKDVTIYFSNCCKDNIAGTYITVFDVSCAHVTSDDLVQTLTCDLGMPVSKIGIRQRILRQFYLCEVVVNGYPYTTCYGSTWGEECKKECDCASGTCNSITGHCEANIALNKPVTSSLREGGGPAVDGHTGGHCPWMSGAGWWTVDLSAGNHSNTFVITNVTVLFFHGTPEGSTISVGNSSDIGSQKQCVHVDNPADITLGVPCATRKPVRYLSLKTVENFHLCEVIVSGYQYQGCPEGMWGRECMQNCSCDYEKCNDITGCRDVNDCASIPCLNGGACANDVISYTCNCTDTGYIGTNCEIDVNECASFPCQHGGTCANEVNSFSCDCTDTGYAGTHCETEVDECDSSPCQNNGTCVDNINAYECICTAEYAGTDCSMASSALRATEIGIPSISLCMLLYIVCAFYNIDSMDLDFEFPSQR